MARAFPQTLPSDFAQDPGSSEWQSLRGELVALLDQVEGRVNRSRDDSGYQSLAERMRDLRYQMTPEAAPASDTRQREALRSVQRSIERFHDRDEAAAVENPRDTLRSAISQIRSRQFEAPTAPQPAAPPAPRFDELASAVNAIGTRLERLEHDIRMQLKSNGSVKDVTEQMVQLSHVVELLAGAVGETGQVKRLEGQIASLGKLVAQGREADLSTLTQRLDDVSTTVGRLADLQVQFANKADNPANHAALRDGMRSIEAGVRNVYDRIDTLERSAALGPAEIDHLSAEMARFTDVMKSNATPPANLVALLDELNTRISAIESGDHLVEDLRGDLTALRDAVVGAFEPRFAAIEQQLFDLNGKVQAPTPPDLSGLEYRLDAISEHLAERPIDPGIGQLEAQVRQLVARMDQTGEQLSGLAKLYVHSDGPDLEALADMVAARTSDAVARLAPPAAGISEASLNGLEARVTALLKSVGNAPEPPNFDVMETSIQEVGERLARIEEALLAERARQAIPPLAVPEEMRQAVAAAIEPRPAAFDMGTAQPLRQRSDAMPANPAADAPLLAPAFPDAMGGTASRMTTRKQHPGLDQDLSLAARFDEPPAKSPAPLAGSRAELPPAPTPSFGLFDGPAPEVEATPEPMPVSNSSRNTFIEAARRAAQHRDPKGAEPGSSSLIGRALARFQSANAGPGAAAPEPKETKRLLAGDKPARKLWRPEPAEPTMAAMPEPAGVEGVSAIVPEADGRDHAMREESFLSRHRKPILLAASVVALAFLTLNLVMQHADQVVVPLQPAGDATATDPVSTGTITDSAALPLDSQPMESVAAAISAPRVIPMTDSSLTTGSIDKGAAQNFAASPPAAMPPAFQAATALASAAPEIAPLGDAVRTPQATTTADLPPATLGPVELRQAAHDGNAHAQFEIAAIYTEGRAVKQDYAAAATWYELSADQGFAPAEYRLGSLYENGNGVTKNLETARMWYERAADAGNRMSMHNLAALYAGGSLGKQQFELASQWFEKAARLGLTDSQFNLGMLYARGLGVTQSLSDSYRWFGIAARTGDKDAIKARDDIARSLDAETVSKLNDEIAAWKAGTVNIAANFAPIGTWSPTFNPGETIVAKDIVASVQGALNKLGFDAGTPDGVAGPKTADAIKQFEQGTGMSEVGAINPRLLAVLGSQPV